jgi:hypothetical protein
VACEERYHLKKQYKSAAIETAMPAAFMMTPAASWSSAGLNPEIRRGAYS